MPSLDDWVNLIGVLESFVTIIAIVVAGFWGYILFVSRREKEPRAEFEVDITFVGLHQEHWLVEVSATIENKGLVRHPVNNLRVVVRYLLEDDELVEGNERINYQVTFPHSIDERIEGKQRIMWQETHIDPSLKYRNSYVTYLPAAAKFALVFGRFEYKGEIFTAQKLFKVPKESEGEREASQTADYCSLRVT